MRFRSCSAAATDALSTTLPSPVAQDTNMAPSPAAEPGWHNAIRWYIARKSRCQQRQAGKSAALVQQCRTYRYIRQGLPASARCICSKSCALLRSESGMSSLPRGRPSQYCVLGGGGASDRIVCGAFRLAAWTRGSRATAPSRTTHTIVQIPTLMPNRCFQVSGSAMMFARSFILSLGGP